jgi:hypothetical protein
VPEAIEDGKGKSARGSVRAANKGARRKTRQEFFRHARIVCNHPPVK